MSKSVYNLKFVPEKHQSVLHGDSLSEEFFFKKKKKKKRKDVSGIASLKSEMLMNPECFTKRVREKDK